MKIPSLRLNLLADISNIPGSDHQYCKYLTTNNNTQLCFKIIPYYYKSLRIQRQMEKCAQGCNVGIIKAHSNIVKTRPSNVNSGNINVIALGPTHA